MRPNRSTSAFSRFALLLGLFLILGAGAAAVVVWQRYFSPGPAPSVSAKIEDSAESRLPRQPGEEALAAEAGRLANGGSPAVTPGSSDNPEGKNDRPAAPATPAATRGAALKAPFRAGEKLFFQVGWMNLTAAATAELSIAGRENFHGDAAWHFQAIAHTENPLRYLMVLDDQFDSYTDAASFATRQYELYLNEQGKRSTRKLSLNARRPGTERINAPEGTLDPLAALYKLRSNDWQRTPEILAPIYDGNHFYQMLARRAAAHDRIVVPAGSFDATRIEISVSSRESQGNEMHFTLWLANNGARTPVEVDAEVPVGTVKGQLVRVE
jgi:hypothetical protein